MCWYFRDGHGLLAENGKLPIEGDNRYHAILGNQGPAKFVSGSRLAGVLISLGAQIRVLGPRSEEEHIFPLEHLYRTPQTDGQRENTLASNQLLTHILLPADQGRLSAHYEVRHGAGPDDPLASASATLHVEGGLIREAKLVLGQAAPTPWLAATAAQTLINQPLDERSAERAADFAVAEASPLSKNEYKVQLTRVAVKRAILLAGGFEIGGF